MITIYVCEHKQHGRFIKVTLMKSLPAALTSFFSIAALVVFAFAQESVMRWLTNWMDRG